MIYAAGWIRVPGAMAAWSKRDVMIFPRYGTWTVRRPDGTETAHYTIAAAVTAAELIVREIKRADRPSAD